MAGTEKPKKERLLGLDAFRGLTIVLMLIVNNVALDEATPPLLTHAPWRGGVYLADLVFPWFLLCVGVAIPFSLAGFRSRGLPAWRYDLRVVARMLALVFLGCLIQSAIEKRPVFCLGVLQLIGLAYMVGALLADLPVGRRLLIAAMMLAGYGLALQYIPLPALGAPAFEEEANLVRHINETFLRPFGLAGLPSVAPTGALVLIGSAVGDLLLRKAVPLGRRLAWLAPIGLALAAAGAAWDLALPYSKAVWSPSYILLTAGLGTLALSLFTFLVDGRGWRAPVYPLLVFGSNAIAAYVAPILFKVLLLQTWMVNTPAGPASAQRVFIDSCKGTFGPVGGGWAYTLAYMAIWWAVLWLLYRKRWLLRV